MEINYRRRLLLFSIDVALYLLAKSKYEKNVYAILKLTYQGTITTKKFVCTLSGVESIVPSYRIDLSGTPCKYLNLSMNKLWSLLQNEWWLYLANSWIIHSFMDSITILKVLDNSDVFCLLLLDLFSFKNT